MAALAPLSLLPSGAPLLFSLFLLSPLLSRARVSPPLLFRARASSFCLRCAAPRLAHRCSVARVCLLRLRHRHTPGHRIDIVVRVVQRASLYACRLPLRACTHRTPRPPRSSKLRLVRLTFVPSYWSRGVSIGSIGRTTRFAARRDEYSERAHPPCVRACVLCRFPRWFRCSSTHRHNRVSVQVTTTVLNRYRYCVIDVIHCTQARITQYVSMRRRIRALSLLHLVIHSVIHHHDHHYQHQQHSTIITTVIIVIRSLTFVSARSLRFRITNGSIG
mgnify:CR=1 FL=1